MVFYFSKIILSDKQEIKEIHIITKENCNPKKITRDIESILIAKYNILIDYRKISIAQVQDEISDTSRLKISDIKVIFDKDNLSVNVKLENCNRFCEGIIECSNWGNNVEYVIAKATLEAVTSFMNGRFFFQLEEIKKTTLDEKELFLVGIQLVKPDGKECLVGAALIEEEYNRSIVNATLKAINRRIFM